MTVEIAIPDVIRHIIPMHVAAAGDPWHMSAVNIRDAWRDTGAGEGVKIAVLDTGVDFDHEFFADKKLTMRSTVAGESGRDDNGHGTHCASTVLQMAPKASIISIQVLGGRGGGTDKTVYDGIMAAIAEDVDIVSMSLGGRADSGLLASGMRKLEQKGIPAFVAAGNDSMMSLSEPARQPSAISIGAVDQQYRHASFSNSDTQMRLKAVGFGVRIYAAVPRSMGNWMEMSGTSMATPFIVGLMANYFSLLRKLKRKTPQGLADLEALAPLCKDLGAKGLDAQHGFGFPDIHKIIDWVLRSEPNAPQPTGQARNWRGNQDGKPGTFHLTFTPDP